MNYDRLMERKSVNNYTYLANMAKSVEMKQKSSVENSDIAAKAHALMTKILPRVDVS